LRRPHTRPRALSGRLANRRIRLLLAVFAIVFGATVARAVWLQGVRAQSLGRMAASQHRRTVTIAANRGTIYDSTGVQLAIAAQVLGYAGVDNHGLSGLELSLDRPLAGRPGRETLVRDPFGHVLDSIVSTPARDGRDASLTINQNIHGTAETVLRETVQRWHAKDASAIVLDPHTGAVLAMAVAPTYDANNFPGVSKDLQRNRAITDTYEPRSTFKLVTVAGALSTGIVTPRTAFTLPYEIQVADRRIHD